MQPEHVARLLQDGAVFDTPGPDLLATAEELQRHDLIETRHVEFVRCADPHDADFSRTNRHCRGRIYLAEEADGECAEARCPECERPIHPEADGKRCHRELRVRVHRPGVLAYLRALLADAGEMPEDVAEGVFRVGRGAWGTCVCVPECCAEARFLTRDWALNQPTCYVTVDPRAGREHFLREPWLHRVSLAELVCGQADLPRVLEETAVANPPQNVQNMPVHVYTKGPRPPLAVASPSGEPPRWFAIEIGAGAVKIEGQPIMAAQAVTRYHIFRILWEQYIEDLLQGLPPDRFRFANLDAILRALATRLGRQVVDELSVRRAINRLQNDAMAILRRTLGLPIQRDDVIETCPWQGQRQTEYGYRLNPRTVVARPCQVLREAAPARNVVA